VNQNLSISEADRGGFELTLRSLKRNKLFHFSAMTEAEFMDPGQLQKKRAKPLAGRRRAIGETFVEKNAREWGPSWGDMRIERRSPQGG